MLSLWSSLISLMLFTSVQAASSCPECPDGAVTSCFVQDLLLAQPGCEDLKKFAEDKDTHLDVLNALRPDWGAYERVSNLYTQNFKTCHDSLYKACHPNLKQSISNQELSGLFEMWKTNSNLRMNSPGVHCFQRATLLAHELTEKGYETKIVRIESPSLIGLSFDSEGQATGYSEYSQQLHQLDRAGFHYVVSIVSKNTNGDSTQMYLDPQFADKPMTKVDYLKMLTGQDHYTDAKDNPFKTIVSESVPTASLSDFTTAESFLSDEKVLTDPCGWHENHKYEAEIARINQWDFSSSASIPDEMKDLDKVSLRVALREKNLNGHLEQLNLSLKQSQINLEKLNSGIIPRGIGGDLVVSEIKNPEFKKAMEVALKQQLTGEIQNRAKLEKRLKQLKDVMTEMGFSHI